MKFFLILIISVVFTALAVLLAAFVISFCESLTRSPFAVMQRAVEKVADLGENLANKVNNRK